jgi:acetylornithine deacetylase/succinyl-diaminopimelate desuccinylase-like protein
VYENLAKLVEFPTVTDDRTANTEMLLHIGSFLIERGMHVKMHTFNGYDSMTASTQRDALYAPVMVATHTDVVKVSSPEQFRLRQEGDRLYGRGVLDMKFNADAFMEVVDDIHKEGILHTYNFLGAFTTEEETGGYEGIKQLLEKGYRADVGILPDGGLDWQMQTSCKGFRHFNVAILDGTTAHSCSPWEGDNAIDRLFTVRNEIANLFPDKSDMGPETNTLSLNMFNGGQNTNQVPDKAEMTLDARYLTAEEMDRINIDIGRICVEHSASTTLLAEGYPANFDLSSKYLAPFAELVKEVTGITVEGSRTLGSSDARFFAKLGIPVVSLYPTGGGHHGENEWISATALNQYKIVLRKYLDRFARVPAL